MSVTFPDISNAIFAAVNQRITTALKLPTALPNVAFTPPTRSAWCRLHIQWTGAADEIIGRARMRGVVVLSVFVPIASGYREAIEKASSVRDAMRASDDGTTGLIFEEIRIEPVTAGAGSDAGWFQLNVRAAFFADEQR